MLITTSKKHLVNESDRENSKMKHITALILAGIAALCFTTFAQAGVKVDVCFQIPAGVDIDRGLAVTRMSDGKKLVFKQPWNSNEVCYEKVQSGGNVLYRFEWCPTTSWSSACIGMVAAQVADVWIHHPSTTTWGLTYYVDVPAHNVTFTNTSGQKININVFSSRAVGAALMSSKVNTYGNLGTIINKHFNTWDSPRDVGMLDGCYTVMWTSYSGCPGGWQNCKYDILDAPLCVGGDANATLAVDLDDN